MAIKTKNNYDFDNLIGKVIDYEGCLKSIKSGSTISDSCRKFNIDVYEFRRFLVTKRLDFNDNSKYITKMFKLTDNLLGYEQLYCHLNGEKPNDMLEIPYDVDKGLINAMKTLREGERTVLEEYYIGRQTLAQIAARHGRTPERIRQIKEKAMRKLRSPRRFRMWRYGWNYYIMEQRHREMVTNLTCSEKMMEFESHVRDLVECKDKEALFEIYNDIKNLFDSGYFDEVSKDEEFYNTSISELDLSVRPFNCLKRSGIKTYGQLNGTTYSQLARIRCLGRKSFDEIIKKAKAANIEIINDWEEEK